MLTVLLGGARSGKSTAALRLAATAGGAVAFIATSPRIDGDDDLDARIAAHRAERPDDWTTIETEIDLGEAIDSVAGESTLVIDCLTVWLGNLTHHGHDDSIDRYSADALDAIARRHGDTIAVTNEVGLGIVPADAMSRRYRDQLGRINQRWVAASDRTVLLVAGRALDLSDLDDFR